MAATAFRDLKSWYVGFKDDRAVVKLLSVLNIFQAWLSLGKSGQTGDSLPCSAATGAWRLACKCGRGCARGNATGRG